jgi:hypothetical protein
MADHADATEMLMPHEVRRDGERRRRRRLVAATTSCFIVGTVAAGLVMNGATRDAGSVDPAGQPTVSPTGPGDRVGFVGPPPLGTPPTGPANGELVAAAILYNSGTWVYADGRIINVMANHGTSEQFRGYVVRQLTPSGVEAMRSFLLDGTSGLTPVDEMGGLLIVRDGDRLMFAKEFNGCHGSQSGYGCPGFTFPEDWLPADGWKDPTIRPFVPHAYEVCVGSHEESALLPPAAAEIFLANPQHGGAGTEDCRAVATSDARAIVEALEEASLGKEVQHGALVFELRGRGGDGPAVWFEPILPHGVSFCSSCG